MFPDPLVVVRPDPSEPNDPLSARTVVLPEQPPVVRGLIDALRVFATVTAVFAGAVVAVGLWVCPRQADGATTTVVAAAWCGWLDARG